jgi:hypothetical protein
MTDDMMNLRSLRLRLVPSARVSAIRSRCLTLINNRHLTCRARCAQNETEGACGPSGAKTKPCALGSGGDAGAFPRLPRLKMGLCRLGDAPFSRKLSWQPIIDVIRMLIRKVVIGKAPGHQPASLEIHGRIVTIMAAMEVSTLLEKQLITLQRHHYLDAKEAGLLGTEAKKKELLDAFAEELDRKQIEWKNLQVSVVAGA